MSPRSRFLSPEHEAAGDSPPAALSLTLALSLVLALPIALALVPIPTLLLPPSSSVGLSSLVAAAAATPSPLPGPAAVSCKHSSAHPRRKLPLVDPRLSHLLLVDSRRLLLL